jgi:hypothetical protein
MFMLTSRHRTFSNKFDIIAFSLYITFKYLLNVLLGDRLSV